jgi:chemotaxis protein methyltransferase CheR
MTKAAIGNLPPEVEALELRLFLEAVYERYGYDFREYALASLKRRLAACREALRVDTLSELQAKILHSPEAWKQFILTLSVDVTALFRDPDFYLALRQHVFPSLLEQPFVRLWSAGCSSGEEVFSLAILMQEAGLYPRCRLYATDFNDAVLHRAQAGIFPLKAMQTYTANYQQAGGQQDFSDYYTAKYGHALLQRDLQQNIVWAQHNLATDASFNEFHLILCRNVMIYFNPVLTARVHTLLFDSLAPGGFLGLGSKESIDFSPHQADYEVIDAKQKLYRRKAGAP